MGFVWQKLFKFQFVDSNWTWKFKHICQTMLWVVIPLTCNCLERAAGAHLWNYPYLGSFAADRDSLISRDHPGLDASCCLRLRGDLDITLVHPIVNAKHMCYSLFLSYNPKHIYTLSHGEFNWLLQACYIIYAGLLYYIESVNQGSTHCVTQEKQYGSRWGLSVKSYIYIIAVATEPLPQWDTETTVCSVFEFYA